jgi:hypothetical protein
MHAHPLSFALVLATLVAAGSAQAGGPACVAQSAATAATVVELYTSEGCSSCPPADRWLGTLGARTGVVALGFHVDYWDGLGWKDRFASPAFTRRQADSQRISGARFSYTPQVIVDGQDWHAWPSLPTASHRSPVALTLARDGADGLRLQVEPAAPEGARAIAAPPARLSAEIAVVDDRLQSRVQAGENRGETLRHDDVVRAVVALPAWAGAQPHAERVVPAERVAVPALEAGASRHWTAVVRDADTGRPVQAVELRCGS